MVSWKLSMSLFFCDWKNKVDGSFFTNILLHINLGEFTKLNIGDNCPKDHVIDTEDKCKDAASALGMRYGCYQCVIKDEFSPAGCYWYSGFMANFNEITDPSQTIPKLFGPRGGICRITSKRLTYYYLDSSFYVWLLFKTLKISFCTFSWKDHFCAKGCGCSATNSGVNQCRDEEICCSCGVCKMCDVCMRKEDCDGGFKPVLLWCDIWPRKLANIRQTILH